MGKLSGGRGILLNLVPAVMLGGAVAFLAAVAPLELIERLVARSHLALLVPQARPPIGLTGRALVAGGLGGGTAVAAFLAALVIGRFASRTRARPAVATPAAVEMPVLRRADRHPDAPATRPLFALGELGQSFDALGGEANEPVLESAPAPAAEVRPPFTPSRRPTPADQSMSDLLARLEQGMSSPAEPLRRAANG